MVDAALIHLREQLLAVFGRWDDLAGVIVVQMNVTVDQHFSLNIGGPADDSRPILPMLAELRA